MCYDSAMQEGPLKDEMALPNYAVKVPSRIAAEPAVIEQAAEMLVAADNPLCSLNTPRACPSASNPRWSWRRPSARRSTISTSGSAFPTATR